LAAHKSCTVSVFFTPSVTGARSGTLVVSDNASSSPTVALTGTGVLAVILNPASLSFASQPLGTNSAAQSVTMTNNQAVSLSITSIATSLTDFGITSTCPISTSTLAAHSSCSVAVMFAPKAAG